MDKNYHARPCIPLNLHESSSIKLSGFEKKFRNRLSQFHERRDLFEFYLRKIVFAS